MVKKKNNDQILDHEKVKKTRKKKVKHICKAIKFDDVKCTNNAIIEEKYCGRHDYYLDFSDEDIEKMKNGTLGKCIKHYKWIPTDTECLKCIEDKQKKEAGKCIALNYKMKKCEYKKDKNINYCKRHSYLLEFSEENLQKIKNGKMNACSRCNHWHLGTNSKRCDSCVGNTKITNEKKTAKIKKTSIKCKAIDRHGVQCKRNQFNKTNYCDRHAHWNKYTDEQIKNNFKLCSDCKTVRFILDGFKTCNKCHNRAQVNRTIIKEENTKLPGCDVCGNLRKDNTKYCGKHAKYIVKNQIEKDGMKVCSNFKKRKCVGELDKNSKYSKCNNCRKRERNSFGSCYARNKRSAETRDINWSIDQEHFNKVLNKPCYTCGKINKRGWNGCRRIKSNKGFIEQNLVPTCYRCSRMRTTLNIEDYIQHCTNIVTNLGKINNNSSTDMEYIICTFPSSSYNKYKKSAKNRGKEFKLTKKEFNKIVNNPCYMCGVEGEGDETNGVDRFDNTKGYVLDNCKPCCKVCNIVKRDFVFDDVINKAMDVYKFSINSSKKYVNDELEDDYSDDGESSVSDIEEIFEIDNYSDTSDIEEFIDIEVDDFIVTARSNKLNSKGKRKKPIKFIRSKSDSDQESKQESEYEDIDGTKCGKCRKVKTNDNFIGNNGQSTVNCKNCRNKYKKFDAGRIKKKKYNPQHSIDYRKRQKESLGVVKYKKQNADNMKKYRDKKKETKSPKKQKTPEEIRESNRIKVAKYRAKLRANKEPKQKKTPEEIKENNKRRQQKWRDKQKANTTT